MIGSDTNYNGSLEIPNLSDENDAEEIDVSSVCTDTIIIVVNIKYRSKCIIQLVIS